MAITFRDEKGAPLTHEELDANFRSFFFTASFGENNLTLIRKDGVSVNVPVGGEAFADFQTNGGSIGDVFIANSQITGSRMIIDLQQGQFYDKTKAMGSDGGGLKSDEWYIDFDPASSAPYYVHFGTSFAISSSGYLHASGARLEGDITASSGLIGGFSVSTSAISGPKTLGTPSFYISGSAGVNDHFISASNFNIKGSGDITGSAVLFSGGTIAGWEITNSQIRKASNIVLDATNESIYINNSTFGNEGIQLEYNSGAPRFYVGDGANSFVKYDGTNVTVSTKLLEISASNIEISSTEASMSLGNGNIELLGNSSAIHIGSTNVLKLSGSATDAFLVAGTKQGFATDDAGIIIGMDATVPTLDLTKDASNYVRFNTNDGVDIKTDTFKLDTTYFDIDSSTQRLNIFDTASAEIIRLGEISDDASDLYGIKIFNGSGTGSAQTIAMFGQQGNKIGGWEVTDSQIRSIPLEGFGGTYGEDETGLIIHSSGRIESSNFVTNVKGWRIDTLGNGSAEFENMRIRGTLKTTVFEKETVNVVGGQLMVANATTIEPLRAADGTIIAGSSSYAENAVTFSVANVSGFAEGEILKVKSVDDTGFSVEYLYVSGSSRYSQHANLSYDTGSIDPDGLAGEIYVQRAFGGVVAVSSSLTTLSANIVDDLVTSISVGSSTGLATQNIIKIDEERFKIIGIDGNTLTVIRGYHDTAPDSHTLGDTVFLIDTDKEFLAGLVSTAKPYNEGQVLVSTGVFNPSENISSGYILMNANPRDVSTPYMDIVERTGSGVYDLQLRSRLGDLSGLSSGYLYGDNEPGFGLYTENGYFKGAITAQTGSIAGILHVATVQGGLETGQKISIGREVQGSNDGIYVNNNNYWYTDGAWKVGGQTNYITLDNYTDGNLTIRTQTFTLDTPNMIISSSLNNGTITMGANADTITETAESGIYMDGNGKFRVGTGTTGDNYIYWDGSTLNIKGAIDITGGTGVTQDQLNTATGSAVSQSNAYTNQSTSSLSGSVAQVTDTLDDKIFTDNTGRAVKAPTASTAGLYMASTHLGFYESGKWKTYMDNQGDFFLTGSAGNKLAWDSSAGILEIAGAINITGGNAATQDYVNTATGSLSGSLATTISSSNAALSSSLSSSNATLASQLDAVDSLAQGKTSIFKQATAPATESRVNGDMWIDSDDQNKVYIFDIGTGTWVTTPDGTYDQTDLINQTSSSLSSSIALDLFTDSTGKIVRPPNASAAGLYLGDSNLGFYENGEWKTYMADNGNFYLTGSSSNYLFWDGNALNIAGSINITSGNVPTTSSFAAAVSASIASGSAAAATAQANAQTYTNQATSSLSGSIASDISSSNAELSSSIAGVSGDLNSVSASQALVNQGLDGVISGKNAIFRQATQPSSTNAGDIWIETDQGNKLHVYTGTAWVTASDATYDQTQLISNTSASLALDTFTDSSGRIQKTPSATTAGLYLGDTNLGYYDGSSWATFMADNGNFFLTGSDDGYLKWDGGALTISGNINVLGGNAATSDDINAATSSLSGSLATGVNQQVNAVSASTALAQQTATLASGTATAASQAANNALTLANTAVTRSVDSSGKITFPSTPTGAGLFIGADKLGYYANSAWKTYMSSSGDFYLVGDGNNGMSWDGSDLSVDGTIVARSGSIGGIELDADKLYIGTGTYDNSNTKFFVSSSGKFSLGDKLVWDGTNLTIEGSITVTNANDFASQEELNAATASAALDSANAVLSGSNAASAVQTNLNNAIALTSSLANPSTYAFGPSATFTLSTAVPQTAGLYLGSNNLGYYNGGWKAYMDSSGNFLLSGNGDDGLTWDGSTLRIGNKGVGPSLAYQFNGALDSNVFDFSISNTTTISTPVIGSTFKDNGGSWNQGFHSKALFDRQDGVIFEWDIMVGPAWAEVMVGLYRENPSSYHHDQMSHAVFFDTDNDIRIYESGSQRSEIGTNAWTTDNDYSEKQTFRIRIQPLPTGAKYEIFKNGDFTTPTYTYNTSANNITERYLRPGAAISTPNSTPSGVIFQGMAGGASLGQATKISGNTIQTGVIESSNLSTTLGSQFNLDDGTFKLGGTSSPKLNWNGSTLSIIGNIQVTNPDSFATPAEKNKEDFRIIVLATGSLASTNVDSIQYLASQGYTGGNGSTYFYDNNNASDGNDNPANISGFDTQDYDLYIFDNRNWAADGSEIQLALNLFDLGKSVLITGNDSTAANYTGSYNTEWPIKATVARSGTNWMAGPSASGKGMPASHPILAGITGNVSTSTSGDGGTLITQLKAFPKGGTVVQPFSITDETGTVSNTNDVFTTSGTGQGITSFIATNPRGGRLVNLNLFSLATSGTYGSLSTQAAKNLTSFLLRTDPAIEAHYMQVTSITGEMVTTGKINSANLNEGTGTYTTAGTLFDLDNGAIKSKSFAIDSSGNAYFKGNLTGASGIFSGTLSASTGSIGGWILGSNTLSSTATPDTSGYTTGGITLNANGNGSIHTKNFYIDTSGNAYLRGNLSGSNITGASGTFSGTVEVGGTPLTIANTLNTTDPMTAGAVNFNPNFLTVAADGRPAGVRSVYGSAAVTNIAYSGSSADGVVKLQSTSNDTSIGAGFSAFRINPGAKYKFVVRIKSQSSSTSGLYIRFAEYHSELLSNKDTVSWVGSGTSYHEPEVQTVDSNTGANITTSNGSITNVTIDGSSASSLENIATTTSYRIIQGIYTPTTTARNASAAYASMYILNWDGAYNNAMHIDRVYISETTEDIYTGTVAGWTVDDTAIYSGTKDTTGYTDPSTGGITISSGGSIHSRKFYIDTNGDAFFKGNLTGASGTFSDTVSGATITGGTITIGSNNSVFKATTSGIQLGHATFSSAPFRVTPAGSLTTTLGNIGNWVISSGELRDSNTRIELDPNDKAIRLNDSGGTTRVEMSSENLSAVSPTRAVNAGYSAFSTYMATKRDPITLSATADFDQSSVFTVTNALNPLSAFSSWGPGTTGRDINTYQFTSTYTHAGGDLPIIIPFGAKSSTGRLYVQVPDLNSSSGTYGTFYDHFDSVYFSPHKISAIYKLQKEVSGGTSGSPYWSDVMVGSVTTYEVIMAETSAPYYLGIVKSDLRQISAGSSTYYDYKYFEDGSTNWNWNAQTVNRTFASQPAGNYRVGVKYKFYYSANLAFNGVTSLSTGTATASPSVLIQLDLYQHYGADTPVTFGSFTQKVNIGLNGVQVSGVSGSVVLGEVNDTGAASIYGNALVTGKLTANTTAFSDERLKENIKDIEDPLALIGNLQPRSFRWKHNVNPYETRGDSYGFIAQEVTGSLPELVSVEPGEIGHTRNLLTLDQMPIVALNTAGIKALMDKVNSLEAKVQELETQASGSQ